MITRERTSRVIEASCISTLQPVSEHCIPITSALFSYVRLLSAHIFAQSLVIVSRTKAFQFMINIKLAAYLWMLQIIA